MGISATFIATINYLNYYRILFFILSISFFLITFFLFKRNVEKKKIVRFLLFALLTLIFAFYVNNIPAMIELGEHIDGSLSRGLILSTGLFLFALIGVFLSFVTIYDFSAYANQYFGFSILTFSIIFVIYPLILIMGNIIFLGAPSLSLEFLTGEISWSTLGTDEAGIFAAIVGTLLLMLITFLVAVPLGIGAAIYLQEYARKGLIVRIILTSVNILRGTPSIVFGLFGLAVFVPIFGPCLLTAGLILGFYALPMVIRSSEEALKSVPNSLREGSLALGATKWQTIRRVVIPPSSPGIITGSILGIGEASGETAPILFLGVVLFGGGIPTGIFDEFHALPYQLYEYSKLSYIDGIMDQLWGIALVLLSIVLIMNIIAIIFREKFRIEF